MTSELIRVAHLTAHASRRSAGVWAAVEQMVHALARQGVVASVAALHDCFSDLDLAGWDRSIPLHLCETRISTRLGYAPGLMPALQAVDADLIHAHGCWMYPSWVSLHWSRRQRRPRMVTPHGMLMAQALRSSRWKKRAASWLFENEHLHGAACLHALHVEEAKALRAYGLKAPICVLPNGIQPLDQPMVAAPPPWRARIAPERKILLFLGRFHPIKGLPALLQAWAQLGSHERRHWCLVLAGWSEGDHQKQLARLIEDAELGADVLFVGPQFERGKAASFATADAFVLPSLSEGVPMAVLEAWAHRLPVVMTPQCNLPQGFAAEAAIRIESTVEGMLSGLRGLFALSARDREEMGRRGAALVAEHFTWPRIATQMLAVYQWLLGGGAPPAWVIMN
jgi:poly(glycerol-phosphate) alpha-glucosyltransferase